MGTSFAAPKVARLAARLQKLLPDEPCLLYRALIAQSARWPEWVIQPAPEILRQIGYGIPNEGRATTNTAHRITLVTSGTARLTAGDAHIYQIPVPAAMRSPEMTNRVLIEVTLSYVARPRRTRRNLKRYLSTWLSWDVSKAGETVESFSARVLKDGGSEEPDGEQVLPWLLRERSHWGAVLGTHRNLSTLQKDWCEVEAHRLPVSFCLAVVGHKGWAENEENAAAYALAISFEMLDKDLEIYEMIRNEVQVQAQVPVRVRSGT